MDKETERPGSYSAWIPAEILYNPDLPDKAKLLYAVMNNLANKYGYCYASNSFLMGLFEFSDRTLQRHLKTLETLGFIRIEDGDGGSRVRRIYVGINPLSAPPDKNVGGPPTKMSVPPDKNVGENNIENKKRDNSPQSPPGGEGDQEKIWDPEAFEAFWKLYPKKKDKQKAIREWNKLKADRKLMKKMSAALKVQMASEEWQRDNGRAVPYPCRWLSHRRWEDEQDVTLPPAQGQEVKRIWLN